MDKKEISNALDEASVIMELAGDNPFRVRAYSNASRIVRAYAGDLSEAIADGSIQSIKGIGPNIAANIAELLESDDPPFLKELRSKFPDGVLEMLRIPGLGPKKIRALMEELDITSIGELEYACRENRLLDLPGFGAKTQENILKGIASLTAYAGRYLADAARNLDDYPVLQTVHCGHRNTVFGPNQAVTGVGVGRLGRCASSEDRNDSSSTILRLRCGGVS